MAIHCLYLSLFTTAFFAKSAYAAGEHSVFFILEHYFSYLVGWMGKFFFFDLAFFSKSVELPFIVVWLLVGAIYLTLRMGFINLRAFYHAIEVTRGLYDKKDDPGEISHFQALASATSATIGLGNIAGVAVAVSLGGPGAIFWLIVAGFLGMTPKFVECSLAVKYRDIDKNGRVLGGPMLYLTKGLSGLGFARTGKFLGALFCLLCIGGSLGGGNMFQANQAYAALSATFPVLQGRAWVFGLLMAFLVGAVIIGGIKRIGKAASVIVPLMCVLYILSCLFIITANYQILPETIMLIVREAFTPAAGYGGFMGVLITGFRRAAFSNEAGMGSAAIAHSAVATKEPVREGIVALLEPFIDTVILCALTGITVVITNAYQNSSGDGVLVATQAFSTVSSWMPILLAISVLLFAYSTMISWCYYGERCWAYLFKTSNTLPYKLTFVVFTFFGSVFTLGPILEFSDLMILGMAFPNMLGLLCLTPQISRDLKDYWQRYQSGQMQEEANGIDEDSDLSAQLLPKA